MGVPHLVRRGDSLWALAGRYLGDHGRWPDIYGYHNAFVRQNGGVGRGLMIIDDPDLIFVGQTVMIPGRDERISQYPEPAGGTGRTHPPVPLNADVIYILDPDPVGPMDVTLDQPVNGAIRYGPFVTPDFTMTSELTGRITLKNMSPTRHMANWELALGEEKGALSYTLRRQGHDAAFLELVGGMEMDFNPDNRRATIKPSLAAKAGLGPYTLMLELIGANQLSGTLNLDAVSGELESHRRKFRFSADVSIKVDVTLHPHARPDDPEPDNQKFKRVPATERPRPRVLPTKTELLIGGTFVAAVVLVVTASPFLVPAAATAAGAGAFAIGQGTMNILGRQRGPYDHVIDPND